MMTFNVTTLIVFLSFLVFMFLMKGVFFEPMRRLKQAREQKLEGDRREALSARSSLDALEADYEAHMKQARQQAHGIIQEVRVRVKAEAADTISHARRQAADDLDQALAGLSAWREEALQALAPERARLAALIIGKIAGGGVADQLESSVK